MATFEHLPSNQRSILELLVQRQQSYDALSELFGEPPARIRDLAHSALASLAPQSSARVDAGWLGSLADYMLAQQESGEAATVRDYLSRSESARAWAYSITDALSEVYDTQGLPDIPGPAIAEPPQAPQQPTSPKSTPAQVAESLSFRPSTPQATQSPPPPPPRVAPSFGQSESVFRRTQGRVRSSLSPAARKIVRRRRLVALIVLVCVIAAGVAIALTQLLGGSSKPPPPPGAGPVKVLRQVVLNPNAGNNQDVGAAIVAEQNNQTKIVVQAKLGPPPNGQAYEVWLYNSNSDVVPLGFPQPNQQGIFQGVGTLPPNYGNFHNVDVTLQKNGDQNYSGNSVLRGSLDQPPPPPPGAPAPAPAPPAPGP